MDLLSLGLIGSFLLKILQMRLSFLSRSNRGKGNTAICIKEEAPILGHPQKFVKEK